jgi:hypothetical protein
MPPSLLPLVLLLPAQENPALVAVRDRQESVRTAFIKFKRTEFVAKESIADATGSRAPFPPEDVTLESVNLLVLDGAKIRFEDYHPVFWPGGKWVRQDVVSVYNGTVAATLWPRGLWGEGKPEGVLGNSATGLDLLSFPLAPLGLALRWSDPALCPYALEELKPSGNTLPLDWEPCREYVLKTPDRLWLDPDYIVRRVRSPARQLDVRYRHTSGVAVPDSWVVSRLNLDGTALVTDRVEVSEARLNEPQPAELFELHFPPGCEVHDQRTTPAHNYIEPTGSVHEVTRGEKASHPPPREPAGPWYWQYRWLLAGLVVVVGGLVAQYVARRRRGRKAT